VQRAGLRVDYLAADLAWETPDHGQEQVADPERQRRMAEAYDQQSDRWAMRVRTASEIVQEALDPDAWADEEAVLEQRARLTPGRPGRWRFRAATRSISSALAWFLVDTNVLAYAYDPRDPDRQARATACLRRLSASRQGTLSAQVLGEFFWVATRRLDPPLTPEQAERSITNYARSWSVYPAQQPSEQQCRCRGVLKSRRQQPPVPDARPESARLACGKPETSRGRTPRLARPAAEPDRSTPA
jgi:hypothetical protein